MCAQAQICLTLESESVTIIVYFSHSQEGDKMKDQYFREIDYARIGVTDSCNLSCHYCKSEDRVVNQLSGEQLKVIVDTLDKLGFRKLRFTGGEPLLNPDIASIIAYASNTENIRDIGLTTNGVLLDRYLDKFVNVGLKRINISLDSLDKKKFFEITKSNKLEQVLANIVSAREKGLVVKVNVVLMKGVNDDEIFDFLEFGRNNDVQFRFIELMPIGHNHDYIKGKQLSTTTLFKNYQKIEKRPNCKDVSDYYVDQFGYVFGIISPMSNHFCKTCNRVRFTSDAKLRLCLHSDKDIDISPYLNNQEQLLSIMVKSIIEKPEEHRLYDNKVSKRAMNRIGG